MAPSRASLTLVFAPFVLLAATLMMIASMERGANRGHVQFEWVSRVDRVAHHATLSEIA
jgi:hypothetical protein